MTELEKVDQPAYAGENDTEKTITYTVTVENTRSRELKGTFKDEADSEITITSISPSAGEITIPAYSTQTYTITATAPIGLSAGTYRNKATFEYDHTYKFSVDDFRIKKHVDEPPVSGRIWKYITEVSGGDIGSNMIGGNREGLSTEQKDLAPVEVSKGTLVTYTIKVEHGIEYENTSGLDEEGNPHQEILDKSGEVDLTVDDAWGEGLEFVSCDHMESQSGRSIKLKWEAVKKSDCPVYAKLVLRVTASDMTLPNIENKASDLRYSFKIYDSWWKKVELDEETGTTTVTTTNADGSVTTETVPVYSTVHHHELCHWVDDFTEFSGNLGGEEYDFIRLLDPFVRGLVWDDIDKNGLRENEESIATLIREDYKNVSVKLWRSDGTHIATKTIDENGHYDFGRVRKGTVRSDGSNDWWNIPDGESFNYNNASLVKYYITFEYNGERYQSTTPVSIEKDKLTESNPNYKIDSNAEEQNRPEFNNSLETISYNRAFGNKDGSGDGKPLAYNTETDNGLQISKLKWTVDELGIPNANWPSNYTVNQNGTRSIAIIAKTGEFYFEGGEIDYLQHIDLGIYQRDDDADLSATKDVVKAEVTVNAHKTTYEYEGLGSNLGDGADYTYEGNHNVQKTPYILSVYREDYEYRTAKCGDSTIQAILNDNNPYKDLGRDNDLHVILTYKITVKNNSTKHKAVVREIIDYASNELEVIDTKIDSINGIGLLTNPSSTYKNPAYSGNMYHVSYLTGAELNNRTLDPGATLDVYIRYRVLRDSNGFLLVDDGNEGTEDSKMNIVEIGAYSVYDMNGTTPSGLVDKNSNPGNVEYNGEKADSSKFEDDTFETGILVVLKDRPKNPLPDSPDPERDKRHYRNISGIVFEEDLGTNTNTYVDGQLVGNGAKDGNDKPAANVLVKLYEVVRRKDGSEEFYVDTGLWYRTGADGKYYFGDKTENITSGKPTNGTSNSESKDDCYKIHAGIYTVRFIYGDEADKLVTTDGNTIKFSGQDYQSAKYTDVGNLDNPAEIVKASVFANKAGNTNPFNSKEPTVEGTIYSVARDNEIRRLEVNEYSTTTTYLMDTVLKANPSSEENKLLASHTSMFADTKAFDMDIEYYDNYTDKTNFTFNGKSKTISTFYYSVRNINFGLIERPKTKLQLMNDITEVRAITSDGNTLLDVFFDVKYEKEIENGRLVGIKHTSVLNTEKSIGREEVQVLNRNGANQGFRYANIDTDLLQGMTITIKFKVAVANISDIDHIASWLEEKVKESRVDLDVKRYNSTDSTQVKYDSNDSKVTDIINGQEREYNYEASYLYQLLYNGDTSRGINRLRGADSGSVRYFYDPTVLNESNTVGSSNVRKAYTYTNIRKNVKNDYKIGNFLGNIYYNGVNNGDASRVETKVDQFIDYVDNDLIFKSEENLNNNGQITYLTYTTQEIAKKGLLKDITDTITKITDGEKDYYNADVPNTNNNLAFNIEDGTVNSDFYKFLAPIENTGAAIPLYTIDLQASRTLTSELDMEGMVIDNIAEIVKSTNTVGRKVYVKSGSTATGYLGNTTKDPIESINEPGSTTSLVDIAKTEIDTDFTEYVTFSPPTGLTEQQSLIKTVADKTGNVLLILVPVIIIIVGMSYVTVQFIKRKKFYK